MDFNWLGKFLVIIGFTVVLIGVFLMLFPKIPFLGKLPGDIHVKRGNYSFYFPITTCIVISILLSLILRLFKR